MKKELENILNQIIGKISFNKNAKDSIYSFGEKYFEQRVKKYLKQGFRIMNHRILLSSTLQIQ